jgi:tetratricopeptide (TPR) repeat protein
MLGATIRIADYAHADLSKIMMIAMTAPCDHPVALNAAMLVLVHKAKVGAPVEELELWRGRAESILESVIATRNDFTSALLVSRFYRAAAFVPQREGRPAEVTRMMDVAEKQGRALVPTSDAEELLRLENLYPILESRTKEALWLGELDLALARAESLVSLDPYDSRAWLELGEVRLRRAEYASAAEAYATAAILGAPSTAIGCHMAGLCFRKLGQSSLAAYFFEAAIRIDPQAISPREQIQELPDSPVLAVLKNWSLGSMES